MFNKITIIGCGLIGSSLARAIKKNNLAETLVVVDSNEESRAQIRTLGFADRVMDDAAEAVHNADVVVLGVPVGAFRTVLTDIKDHVKGGAIITDVGSTKKKVLEAMEDIMPDTVHVIPGHPIAGAENSGPTAGSATLFQDRWLILTPSQKASADAVETLKTLWEKCGAMVEVMDTNHHDEVLAVTSHLPHLIAFSMIKTAADLEEETTKEIIQYSAGGFRDFTRVAASDPTMWRDILLENKDVMLPLLQRFSEDLTILQKFIRRGDGDALYDYLDTARTIRRSMNK